MKPAFKLFILGALAEDVTDDNADGQLTILAEFEGCRAPAHRAVRAAERNQLKRDVRDLRSAIESGGSRDYGIEHLKQLGASLLRFAFPGNANRLLQRATGASMELLPFELFVEDPEIAGWPWEYLYDEATGHFLCQEFHPISRGIFTLAVRKARPRPPEKIRLLLIIGVLDNDPTAKPADQLEWIEGVFNSQLNSDCLTWKVMRAVRPGDIDGELQRGDYDVLHFFGHAGFDHNQQQGYLRLQRDEGIDFKFYSGQFAQMLRGAGKTLRLVFLNGCETGRGSSSGDPARSAIAAASLEAGVPAVIATQFSIPDVSAHHLAAKIYSSLANGDSLNQAMMHGRRALNYPTHESKFARSESNKEQPNRAFFDWGIPVLYASEPEIALFPKQSNSKRPKRVPIEAENVQSVSQVEAPKLKVLLIDFDSKINFLQELAKAANNVQTFYKFLVDYLPCPSSTIRKAQSHEGMVLFAPDVQSYLLAEIKASDIDIACVFTPLLLADDEPYEDGSPSDDNFGYVPDTATGAVMLCFVSSCDIRKFAAEAGVSFAKAMLNISLSMILAGRWNIKLHKKTVGCMFDFCDDRHDLVVGLKKMALDHKSCRIKIQDWEELAAIDRLLAMKCELQEGDEP